MRFSKIKLSEREAVVRVCDAWHCHTRLAEFGWKDAELSRDPRTAPLLFCERCKEKAEARASAA